MADKDLLTQEELVDLITKAQSGDTEARDIIVSKNMRLVSSIAAHFNSSGFLTFEDLQQEGYFGLFKAIDKFDTKRGYKFSTYATWWIKQSIQRAISDTNRTIRVPVHIQEDLQRINKIKKLLTQELGRDPSIDEIYDKLALNMDWYDSIAEHEYFEILVSMAMDTNDVEDSDLLDLEEAILEDLEFNEDAELIIKKFVKYIYTNKTIPTKDVLVAKVNLSKDKIAEILGYEGNIASLDQKVSDDSDSCLGDSIASTHSVEEEIDQNFLNEGIDKAIDEVYGNQIREIKENIARYETQIEYLNSRVGDGILNISSELINLEDDDTLDETKKNYIREFLANLEVASAKSSKVSLDVNVLINELTTKKAKIEKKSQVPKDELIKRRFGICGYKRETLEELGARYNLSRERIRQIEKKILSGEDKDSRVLKEKLLKYCNLDKDAII